MTKSKKPLTEEEEALWQKAMEDVKPLKRIQKAPIEPKNPLSQAQQKKGEALPNPLKSKAQPLEEKKSSPPRMPSKKLRKPRKVSAPSYQSTLDLHGATLDQAFEKLHLFLTAAQRKKVSVALVITGKGQRKPDQPWWEAHGTLRETVPTWLRGPQFASLVSRVETAQIKDGGSGALYVHIRKA